VKLSIAQVVVFAWDDFSSPALDGEPLDPPPVLAPAPFSAEAATELADAVSEIRLRVAERCDRIAKSRRWASE